MWPGNAAFKKAAEGPMKNVLAYSDAHCLHRPQDDAHSRHRRCPTDRGHRQTIRQSHGLVRQRRWGYSLPCAGPDQVHRCQSVVWATHRVFLTCSTGRSCQPPARGHPERVRPCHEYSNELSRIFNYAESV